MTITRKEVQKRIIECEKNKEFDKHVDPINYDIVIKVDENFPYIKRGFNRLKYSIERLFIVKPFTRKINRLYQTTVYGRENLSGIKNAIITCNHVDMFDCLVVTQALKGHILNITAAPFNNQKGFLGEMMRAGRMMPLSETYNGMKKFNQSIEYYLKNNNYVLFYPEQAMWWHYEKPRPLKNGAFHYAYKHNVPIIPLFITFSSTGRYDDEGIEIKKFNLFIMKPIYPKMDLDKNKNIEYLKKENERLCKEKYEDFYKKPLTY